MYFEKRGRYLYNTQSQMWTLPHPDIQGYDIDGREISWKTDPQSNEWVYTGSAAFHFDLWLKIGLGMFGLVALGPLGLLAGILVIPATTRLIVPRLMEAFFDAGANRKGNDLESLVYFLFLVAAVAGAVVLSNLAPAQVGTNNAFAGAGPVALGALSGYGLTVVFLVACVLMQRRRAGRR